MKAVSLLGILLLVVPLVSCRAHRSLLVTSDPPGATVRIDGSVVGTTPVRWEFVHYGKRRVTLRCEGHCTWNDVIELPPPWYGRFPLDIVSEVLVPVGWKDRRHLHVELDPGAEVVAPPELRSVFERANTLRHAGPEGPPDLPPTRSRSVPPTEDRPSEPPAADGEGGP